MDKRQSPPALPHNHSEAYWQVMKYLIVGLAVLMALAVLAAIVVVLRLIPWS